MLYSHPNLRYITPKYMFIILQIMFLVNDLHKKTQLFLKNSHKKADQCSF